MYDNIYFLKLYMYFVMLFLYEIFYRVTVLLVSQLMKKSLLLVLLLVLQSRQLGLVLVDLAQVVAVDLAPTLKKTTLICNCINKKERFREIEMKNCKNLFSAYFTSKSKTTFLYVMYCYFTFLLETYSLMTNNDKI